MDLDMYAHEATQHNISLLKQRGVQVIDAEEGPGDDDVLTLKVRNNDMQNNRSFVIINHNYRNK